MKNSRTAVLFGATGLVGGKCLELLLDDEVYEEVITFGRRKSDRRHPKLIHHQIDFEHLLEYQGLIKANDVFCCLGTTIKKAGSQEAFRKVDFTFPYEIAKLARDNAASQFLLVSALGADARSKIFYNRVKGELEDALSAIPFEAIQIFRPSLLLGVRNEVRSGEQIAEKASRIFSFLFVGMLEKYRPVHAETVAAAMIKIAKTQPSGVNFYESNKIREVANLTK